MASQNMLAGMKFSITGTSNSHEETFKLHSSTYIKTLLWPLPLPDVHEIHTRPITVVYWSVTSEEQAGSKTAHQGNTLKVENGKFS